MRGAAVFSSAFLALAASGCASAGFRPVSFAGETSTAGSAPADGRTVHVVRNTEMKDTALEMRIRYRLEEFLLDKGYTIAAPDTADIYVLATFGAGERMVPSIAPVFRGAEVKVERTADGQVIRRTVLPDRMEYLRLPMMKNSVWLQVLSSDAKYYRATGQIRNFWRGEASMVAEASSLTAFTPFLLAATLRNFGRGTPDVITVDVRDKDAVWRKQ
jgi:hypothetical protein